MIILTLTDMKPAYIKESNWVLNPHQMKSQYILYIIVKQQIRQIKNEIEEISNEESKGLLF